MYFKLLSVMTVITVRGCEEGHFECSNNSNVCIPQINQCDKTPDCPDGEDEINCDDSAASKFYDNLFRKRPGAEHDDDGDFCDLPYNGSCNCKRRVIMCTHKGLTALPDDLPPNINLLDLTGNKFHVLANQFDVLDVKKLALDHCGIKEIKTGAFYNLRNLTNLHVDNNFLTRLPAGIFPEDSILRILTLRYNEITEIESGAFATLRSLFELNLSNNKISEVSAELLAPLQNLDKLTLEGNFLRSLDARSFPKLPLKTLSLENNIIEYIGEGCFAKLDELENLYLTNNKLRDIENGTFAGLNNLLALYLKDNLLKDIDVGAFRSMGNLTSLDFKGNPFRKLDRMTLKHLTELKHIYFDKFEMCVDAPHVRVCEPKGDGISSQEHLLDNIVLRASVWMMATVGCIGNLVVLLGRHFGGPTNNRVHSLYIKNLALSDLLMGIYLFVIAGVDYHYRGVYLQHQWRWRHGMLCSLCGCLNVLSCESSVLILTLVTWDRFISVTQPLARKQPSPTAAALTLILLWSVAVGIAVAPLISLTESYFGKEFYSSNGLCLPLYLHNPFANGWQYSVVMFVCFNALALLFICYAYTRMIHEIRVSGVACRSTQQSHERDKVAQRFGIIVLTDCLCWVPVIVVKLAALSGMQLSDSYRRFIYASLAIYVLPINSALNPVLYTLTTTLFKKQMRKLFNACVRRRRGDPQISGYDSAFSLSLGVFPKGGSTRRVLTYRGTQSSLASSKQNSCRRPTAV